MVVVISINYDTLSEVLSFFFFLRDCLFMKMQYSPLFTDAVLPIRHLLRRINRCPRGGKKKAGSKTN